MNIQNNPTQTQSWINNSNNCNNCNNSNNSNAFKLTTNS